MPERVHNVLFLCTGNSARSLMAECILNRAGSGRFRAFSAGSHPTGAVNPDARALLRRLGYPTGHLRSKSWQAFAADAAPAMDFVFTVCDGGAGEACPLWPGAPLTGHWGVPDPAAFVGPDAARAEFFLKVFRMLQRRIDAFLDLPVQALDRESLRERLKKIEGEGKDRDGE